MNATPPNSPPTTAADQATATPNAPPRFPFSILLMVWLAVVLVGSIITFILPEAYVSSARIKVERDRTDVPGLADRMPEPNYDPYYLQTESEVIQSELILSRVIQELDLTTGWGKRYNDGQKLSPQVTLILLRGRVVLRPVRNTMLIDIMVYSEDAADAASLANAIAQCYQQFRLEQSKRLSGGALAAMAVKLKEQEAKIRNAREELARLAEPAGNSPSLKLMHLEKEKELEHLGDMRRVLMRRMAVEDIDANLPRSTQVLLIEAAKPGLKPVRPNKPLNISLSLFIGGVLGLLLAGLVYLLERRAWRNRSGIGSPTHPRTTRSWLRTAIALVVGVGVGYNCAEPFEALSLFVMLLFVVLGGFAFVYIELAKPTAPLPSSGEPPRSQR